MAAGIHAGPQADGWDGWNGWIEPSIGAGDKHVWVRPASNRLHDLFLCWQCQRCGARFVASSSAGIVRTSYRSRPATPECRGGFSDVPDAHLHGYGDLCARECARRGARTLRDLARGAGWVNRCGRFDAISHLYPLPGQTLSRADARAFGPGLWDWEPADEDEPQLPGHTHEWIWDPPTTTQEIDHGRRACGLLVRCQTPSVPGRARRQFAWNIGAMESAHGRAR